MKILVITTKELTGLNYHRLLIPHIHLSRNYNYKVSYSTNIDYVELKDFNIVVFQRIISQEFKSQEIVKKCHDAGCKVVVDIDDYWELHPFHELRGIYFENKIAEQTIECLKLADYVITTTDFFAKKIREFNKNVVVMPNSIDDKEPQYDIKKINSEKIRIGWIGGVFHFWDLLMLDEAFKDVYRNIKKDKFEFSLGGYNSQYANYEKIFTVDGKYLNSGSYRRLNALGANQYASMYNELDVALVPLRDDMFNSFKSQIKIIEAGWFKKAVIVSNVMPYTIDCNKSNAVLINNKSEWNNGIRSMILNKNRREDLAENLHEHVKENYNMDKVNDLRNELYQLLCT